MAPPTCLPRFARGQLRVPALDSPADSQRLPRPRRIEPFTQQDLDSTMRSLAASVSPWDAGSFGLVRCLEPATRNRGTIDVMENRKGEVLVVKRMPNRWIMTGPKAFQLCHPGESEQPWHDLGFVRLLEQANYPYVCNLLGIFRDEENTAIAMSLATCGDLYAWSVAAPEPGEVREAAVRDIASELFHAVEWLHELGIGHRDLSLENVLLTGGGAERAARVRVIDFGAATLSRSCRLEARGKPAYQAPEMQGQAPYDPLLADGFSLGVLLYGMAARGYPWASTKPGVCRFFEYACARGIDRLLRRKALIADPSSPRVIDVLSPSLTELIVGLLQVQPSQRLGVQRNNLARDSVWECAWMLQGESSEESSGESSAEPAAKCKAAPFSPSVERFGSSAFPGVEGREG